MPTPSSRGQGSGFQLLDVTVKNITSLTAAFPQSGISERIVPTNVRLVMRPGAHDVAVLTLNTPLSLLSSVNSGMPVTIDWNNPKGKGSFRGYVYRADPVISQGKSTNTLVCVGASFPLMGGGQHIWTGVNASDVVREVAALHGLDYDVEEHPRVYAQVVQAGESYWKLLNRLADETGYILRMDGATIRFRSRGSFNGHFRPLAIPMDFYMSQNPNLKYAAEIQEFRAKVGSANPEFGVMAASRAGSGINPVTGEVISNSADLNPLRASSSPVFNSFSTDRVVNSAQELDLALQAEQEKNRFTRFAEMDTLGDPTLTPERVVYLRGLDRPYNGFWTVRSVVHDIRPRKYLCQVSVATDGLGGPLNATGETPYTRPGSPAYVAIDPHRQVSLSEAADPVLESSPEVSGLFGTPVKEWRWAAPVRGKVV